MDALAIKDWLLIAFGAGGVIVTSQYALTSIKELKQKVDRADNRVHNVELGMGKMETKMDGFMDEMRRTVSEMKRQNNG